MFGKFRMEVKENQVQMGHGFKLLNSYNFKME